MALAFTNEASNTGIVSGSTLPLTATAARGTMLILSLASDNAGASGISSFASVSDTSGNVWNLGASINRTLGAANDGTTLTTLWALVDVALAAGTITINYSPNTTAKSAVLYKVTGTLGEMIKFVSADTTGATGGSTTFTAPTVSVNIGDTIIGITAQESNTIGTGDSDTTNGAWSAYFSAIANVGAVGNSQAIGMQYKTVTATGNQTYNTSSGTARDFAITTIILSSVLVTGSATAGATAAGELTAVATMTGSATAGATASGALTAAATMIGTATATVTALAFASRYMLASGAIVEPPDRLVAAIVAYWPASLPSPTVAGFSLSVTPGVTRAAMEYGGARAVRKGKRIRAEIEVSWQLDGLQQMTFDAFYRDRANEGGSWFAVELGFPVGARTVVARFFDKVSMKAIGGLHWTVKGKLEVLDRPCMTAAEVTAALDDAGDPPAWPDETLLPRPLRDSWTLEPQPIVARSDDLPGLPAARRRSLNAVTTVDSAWELTPSQAALFDGFYRWRGIDGAQWFKLPVFAGIDMVLADARFTGETTWKPHGGIGGWRVAATVEIRQRFILSSDDLAEIGDIQSMLDVLDRIHQDVNDLQDFYDSQIP